MEDIKQNLEKLTKFARNPDFAKYSESLEQSEKLDNLHNSTQEIVEAVKNIPQMEIPPYPEIPPFPTTIKVEIEDLEKLKGEKGDAGYTPVKGLDYFDGVDGYTPIKDIDYFDGKAADEDKIINEVISKIPIPKDGVDGQSPKIEDIVKTVVKYLKELKGDDKLSLKIFKEGSDIVGKVALHANMMKNMPQSLIEGDQRWGGHGSSSSSTGTFNYQNPLTGVLGTASVYTFTNSIGQLVLNSQIMIPGVDYTGQGTTTATFLNGFIPQPPSLVNIYLS